MGVGSGVLSGVILTGRRFPGSSAPGDLGSLGVGGRPAGFWGCLFAVEKAEFDQIKIKHAYILYPLGPSNLQPLRTHILFPYLPGEGAVILLFFLPGEEEYLLGGKVKIGTNGSDRLPHDFLTLSRPFCCWRRR